MLSQLVGGLVGGRPFGIISVTEFGARGDGTADDTAAIQAAIDAANGGTVYLPPGTYRITSPINITVTGTVLIGAARNKSIIQNENASGGHAIVTASGIRGCTIQHLAISGAAGSGDGIHVSTNFGHIRIIDVSMSVVGNGVYAESDGIDLYLESVTVENGLLAA